MKFCRIIVFAWVAIASANFAYAQGQTLIEATAAQVTAGTAGPPYYLTPRRVSGGFLPKASPAFTGTLSGPNATFSGLLTLSSTSGDTTGGMLVRDVNIYSNTSKGVAFDAASSVAVFWRTSGTNRGYIQSDGSEFTIASKNFPLKLYANDTLALTLSNTDQSATFAAYVKSAAGLITTGALVANPGVPGFAVDYGSTSSLSRFIAYGADTSTNGNFQWTSRRSNGSNDLTPMTLTSAGALTTASGITVASGAYYQFSTATVLRGATNGALGINNSAETAGILIDASTDGTAKFRDRANSADAAVTTGNLTIGGGTAITKVLSATATLDFASTGSGAVDDKTITVTGAAVGDTVAIGVPNGSVTATASFIGWVSATNTVTVRFSPKATEDPASGTFRADVIQH